MYDFVKRLFCLGEKLICVCPKHLQQKSNIAASKGAIKPLVPSTIARHGVADANGILSIESMHKILLEAIAGSETQKPNSKESDRKIIKVASYEKKRAIIMKRAADLFN